MWVVLGCLVEEVGAVGEMVLCRRCFSAERRLYAFGVSQLEGAIDLVGGDVIEPLTFIAFGQRLPIEFGSL